MPLQNRVQPDGAIIAHPARGRFMGNRGILHDDNQTLGRTRWRHKAWVTCVLSFKERHRAVMSPRAYTELFFSDEAVAFAAGHRPCGECRRKDFNRFRELLEITGKISAFDDVLHDERAIPRTFGQRRHRAEIASLPTGSFILSPEGQASLVWHDALYPYAPGGYGTARQRPKSGEVCVLTPPVLLRVLHAGYPLQCDPGR